jgi:hypothetical protein
VRYFIYSVLAALFFLPSAFAQSMDHSDHVNVGIYGNFLRLSNGDLDMAGVGGRVSFNVAPRVQFEAETAYDFDQTFSEGFTTGTTGTVSIGRTDVRVLDALFGPKFETNRGPVRLFVTAKGGFMNFNISSSAATVGTFTNTFANLRGSNLYGAFYPGGGAEAFWGPFGVRVDIGDEMFFNNGAHNNLRISFGPTLRF